MLLSVVTAAAKEPLDWEAEVKAHLRVSTDDEQALVEGVLIKAAAQICRNETNLSLITQTLRLTLDGFPCDGGALEIPRPPLRTFTHIKYIDEDGVQQTLSTADYTVSGKIADFPPGDDGPPDPGLVYPAYDKSWPTTRTQRNAVELQWTAGYGDTFASVPAMLRAAMLLVVGEMFERREEIIVGTITSPVPHQARSLFRRFRVPKFREGWAA